MVFLILYTCQATPQSKRGEIPLVDLVVSPASEGKMGHPNAMQLMYPEMYKNEMSVRMIYIYAEAPKVNNIG